MSKVIGITGGIATGKSTVSELLTAYGFKIVDADIASREAVKKALRVLNKLKRFLGKKQLTKMVDESSICRRDSFNHLTYARLLMK